MSLTLDKEKLRNPPDPGRVPYVTRMIDLEYQPGAEDSYDLPGHRASTSSERRPHLHLQIRTDLRKAAR